MLFNSVVFFVFIGTVLPVYYALGRRAQNLWLLLASYLFYGWWDWRFLTLIGISTLVDYVAATRMHRAGSTAERRAFLALSLVTNLGILGFFKYFDFFASSMAELLAFFGFTADYATLNILLPVGISFYTFQTLSYSIDVYRGKLEPTREPLTFALYVCYFPQLVAGPIERATHLLPLLAAPRRINAVQIMVGVELIVIGYFKKVGIADTLGPLVDLRFENPLFASGPELVLSAMLFSIQIYCDFSGYSDIARGVSRLFGIELMRNFNQPYLSSSITEFWRRWHISLSSWLRDYLYISLGGNRSGPLKTYRNLMMTMLLGGLWHGASWVFVVWGGLHGLYLSAHKILLERTGASPANRISGRPGYAARLPGIVFTFTLVTFSWIFFRSPTFTHAYDFIHGIVSWRESTGAFAELSWTSPRIAVLVAVLLVIDIAQDRTGHHAVLVGSHWALRAAGYAGLVLLTLTLGNLNENVPFIYFQF